MHTMLWVVFDKFVHRNNVDCIYSKAHSFGKINGSGRISLKKIYLHKVALSTPNIDLTVHFYI